MKLQSMRRFLANKAERDAIGAGFEQVGIGLVLSPSARSCAERLPASGGCYFWILDIDGDWYKIYLGQTRSLRKRVTDYSIDIQIHSPNDFKMRFFQELVLESWPQASLNLHFIRLAEIERKARETALVRQFDPLINDLRPPTVGDRAIILDGFRQYYRAAFAHRCGDV